MSQNPTEPSKRILVADDDPVIRHLVTTLVSREGFKVVVANDGDEAFRILQRDADFRAALFDMMMPGLKGLDVLRFMKTENRLLRIPVMMITSEKDLTLMTQLFGAGATAILPKPFTTVQLQSMLHMVIGQQPKSTGGLSKKLVSGHDRRIGIRTQF